MSFLFLFIVFLLVLGVGFYLFRTAMSLVSMILIFGFFLFVGGYFGVRTDRLPFTIPRWLDDLFRLLEMPFVALLGLFRDLFGYINLLLGNA